MGIRKKVIIVQTILLTILIGFFLLFSDYFIKSTSKKYELKDINSWTNGISALLDSIDSELLVRAGDWANWDDTYEYAKNKNAKFIDRNLNSDGYKSIQVDFFALVDLSGKIIYIKGYDTESESPIEVPQSDINNIFNDNYIKSRIDKNGRIYYYKINNEPYIVSARFVYDSKISMPENSMLIFGRKLSKEINKIRKLKQIKLEYLPYNSANPAQYDENYVSGYIQLKDHNSNNIGQLKVSKERDNILVSTLMTNVAIFMLIAGFLYWFSAQILLSSTLINRLIQLADEIVNIRDTSNRVTVSGDDEITKVATSVNALLTKIENAKSSVIEKEELFKKISTLSSNGVVLIDDDNEIIYWNKSSERIFGYSEAEALESNFFELLDLTDLKESIEEHITNLSQSKEEETYSKLNTIIKSKNNHQLNIEISISQVKYMDKPTIIFIFRNTTEYELSKNKLNTMIDSIQETIAILDTDSCISFISNQVDISLGYKADELVGKKITDIIKETDKNIIFDSLEKIMWAPKAEFSCFFHIKDKKGNLNKVKGVFQNYFHDNSINGILLSFTNVAQ